MKKIAAIDAQIMSEGEKFSIICFLDLKKDVPFLDYFFFLGDITDKNGSLSNLKKGKT